jgi:uncharacterized membrane protein YdfJ with MMPL/SSD domain
MKLKLNKIAALAAGFALVSGAFAQNLMKQASLLITSPNVAQDLNLSATQIEKRTQAITAYDKKRDAITAQIEGASEAKLEAFQNQLNGVLAELQGKLLAILTPVQTNRLKQIAIQQAGVDAMADDVVAADLGLTAAQRSKITAIRAKVSKAEESYQNAVSDALLKVPDPGQDPDALKEYEAKQKAIMKALKPQERAYLNVKNNGDKEMLAVLTPAQLKKWKSMQGKKLQVG